MFDAYSFKYIEDGKSIGIMLIPYLKVELSISSFHSRRASQQKENEVAQGQEQERLISATRILIQP